MVPILFLVRLLRLAVALEQLVKLKAHAQVILGVLEVALVVVTRLLIQRPLRGDLESLVKVTMAVDRIRPAAVFILAAVVVALV
jgi:hypothetical protein